MEVSNLIDMDALKEDLKKKGYKLTPQRRSIVDTIIENEGQHLTAEEIYDKVKKAVQRLDWQQCIEQFFC